MRQTYIGSDQKELLSQHLPDSNDPQNVKSI